MDVASIQGYDTDCRIFLPITYRISAMLGGRPVEDSHIIFADSAHAGATPNHESGHGAVAGKDPSGTGL